MLRPSYDEDPARTDQRARPRQGVFEQTPAGEYLQKLLGPCLSRQGPQPCPGAAGENDAEGRKGPTASQGNGIV